MKSLIWHRSRRPVLHELGEAAAAGIWSLRAAALALQLLAELGPRTTA